MSDNLTNRVEKENKNFNGDRLEFRIVVDGQEYKKSTLLNDPRIDDNLIKIESFVTKLKTAYLNAKTSGKQVKKK